MKLTTPNPVDEQADRAFNGPAFASAVRDLVQESSQRRIADLRSILAANASGDRSSIVRIVNSLIKEEERCCE